MSAISVKESVSIRYLRAIATILIVACHFLQTQENKWAFVLNIGVQLFFVMSGYLYGIRNIENWGGISMRDGVSYIFLTSYFL